MVSPELFQMALPEEMEEEGGGGGESGEEVWPLQATV